jgi:hypothetical protein
MADEEHETARGAATSRRLLLRRGVAGASAAVAASVVVAKPASAATGSTAITGNSDNWGTTQTGFVHNGTSQNGPALNAYRTTGSTTGVQFSENAGLIAQTDITDNDGVIGFCAGGPMSSGVHGFSFNGRGVVGSGDQGVGVLGEIRTGNSSPGSVAVQATNHSTGTGSIGVQAISTSGPGGLGGSFAGTLAPLRLVAATTTGAPKAGTHTAGELFVDSKGDLYYCRAPGTPGTWVNLVAASTSALHFVTPSRVYDSRQPRPARGPLAGGQSRTIVVADGRALAGGAVTVPNLVPAGATGIAYNLTVVNTVNQGFLVVNPGSNRTVTSSAINWFASGMTVANASVVGIDANRRMTVIAGGFGSTDFIVDVVGYYR